jgi:hypothetical protein
MAIEKSPGQTPTEQYLSQLCERTFLNIWAYPNPYKADGKELCDLLVVFENTVFLFFDRESRRFDKPGADTQLNWDRWKKEAITKQIQTATGAKRYVLANRDQIYLDAKKQLRLPLEIPAGDLCVYKIIVAHGAMEACKRASSDNVYGSLGVKYGASFSALAAPFIVALDKDDPVHLLDTHNLDHVLGELDTLPDLQRYFDAKERAIRRFDCLTYCGEEDLLAHYFLNYDEAEKSYRIGPKDGNYNFVMVGEGEWRDFVTSAPYQRRKADNQVSYAWDKLIQKTGRNALIGTLGGNSDVFRGKSAIHEMAKEPRLSRRALSQLMLTTINSFPDNATGPMRQMSFLPSFFKDRGYVFLQVYHPNPGDYDTEYRPIRSGMLEIACGAAKLKFPQLKKVIGIAIDAPKYASTNSEDFILMDCENWTDEQRAHYEVANEELRFFRTDALKERRMSMTEFPTARTKRTGQKFGRNQLCPCGSGKKFKRCHGTVA